MKALSCSAARHRLQAFHDGELAVGDQIAIAGHLAACRACSDELADLRTVGHLLRAAALGRPALSREDAAGFQAGVVNRVRAERDSSFIARARDMFDDMHLVYAGLGGVVAMVACACIMLGMMRFATNERPDSLAAMVAFLAVPGSSANAVAIDVASHERWTARFSAASETAEEDAVFTLAAILTRDARMPRVAPVHAGGRKTAAADRGSRDAKLSTDAKLIEGLLEAVARARFGPAQAEGLPPTISMVWLVTRTTVRASQSSSNGDLQLPAAPAAKKRAASVSAGRSRLSAV